MKRNLLKSALLALMVLVGGSAWAAGYTCTLSETLEVTGYKAKAFYNFQNNTPEVLPTSGDLRYRDGNIWGLHNFGSGTRSATVAIPVAENDILIIQNYTGYKAAINCGTEDSNLSSSTGYQVFTIAVTLDNITFTVPRYGGIVAALVMEKDATAQTANYTINYLLNGEGEPVKTVNGEGVVGSSINTLGSFFNDENTVKYYRADGQPESVAIDEEGNTFNINVRLASTYNYALVSSLGGNIATGSGFEGESVTVAYPRYAVAETKFYEADVTNKEYRKTIALNADNASATVEYAEKSDVNVVFFAEGENVEGMTVSTANNIPVRASNAQAGVATEDVTITSLPAGIYKLHVGIFTSKNAYADQIVNFGIGSETFAAVFTGVNLNEVASDEITVTTESDVKFIAEGSWADAQFDYIWIEKTGDYVAPFDPATAIVNAGFNPEADPLGWDKVTSAQYYDLGMGLIGTYQVRGEHPAATVDETHLATEFAAGLECRWQTNYAAFTQTTAELPAGSYKLTFDVENTNATTTKANYENRFFVKVGETTYTDESTEWMDGKSAWTTHTIAFTLTEASPITISLGYGTGSNNFGVGNTPALFVSHLTLEAINSIEIALIDLQAAIDAAQAKAATYTVGEALFTYAESEIKPLNDAIATAQAAYTAAESAEAVKSATETLNAFVATFAPAMNKPEANKEYTIINKATSLMLSVANEKVTIENKAIVLFTEVEGGWVISNNAETPEYILKTSGNTWTLSTTTTKEEAYVVNFNLADGAYTIQGANGLFGTDNTTAGSAIYANKAVANNGLWTIEEWVEKSDLDIAKDQALATINALPVGNKLFYYIENDINTCITNVNNATTIDEVNSAVATAKASQNLPVADEEYCILNKSANNLMINVADNSVNIAKFATIHIIGVEGGWVISNADKSAYIFKTTDNNWTLENTDVIADAYVVNFNIVDGGYTIQGAKGLFGTDNATEGSAVYADKNLQKNGLWDLVTKTEGEVTGIETVKAETAQKGIYNLNGQKVMKAQKGLYIINGKKVVVK